MKWNAFNFIEPAIDRTKKLLWPFNLKYWMKLGFVSLFSSGSGFSGGGNSGSNVKIPSSDQKTSTITGSAISSLTTKMGWGILGLFAALILVFGLILSFIKSIFTFIFIDALINKNYTIKGSWKKNKSKGLSFFGFKIIIGLISLIILAIIFLPLILQLITQGFEFFDTAPLTTILLSLLPSIFIAIIWIMLLSLFMTFIVDFSLPDMYKQNIRIKKGMKNTFRNIKTQKTESLVYLLARIVFSIAIGLISLILLIPFAIAALIIGAIILIPAYLISKILMFIILGLYVLFLIYAFSVVTLPLSVFTKYFTLLGYEKLFSTSILK